MPREQLTLLRLRGDLVSCAWDKVHPGGGSFLPSRPGSALRAVAKEEQGITPDQALVPCSEGLQRRKRCCEVLDEWLARTGQGCCLG